MRHVPAGMQGENPPFFLWADVGSFIASVSAPMHSLHIDGLMSAIRVVRFAGQEAMSRAFEVTVTFTTDERDLGASSVVGRPATLTIEAEGVERCIHGIASRFIRGEPGSGRAEHHVTLVPATWLLSLNRDSRIFQGLSVPQIVAEVLNQAGIPEWAPRPGHEGKERPKLAYQLALNSSSGGYPAREHVTQYKESDWDFISRLLEEEGIHFFFDHDETSHLLVISDGASAHEAINVGRDSAFADRSILGSAVIPFKQASGAMAHGEHLRRFRMAEEMRPFGVALTDYAFERPVLPLYAEASIPGPGIDVYEHPGRYDVPGSGARLSQVRLEEISMARAMGEGESTSPRLTPGRIFQLTDHPVVDLNGDYLITKVEHRGFEASGEVGAGEERYSCRIEVIAAGKPFRPARSTPKPVIHSVQTAIVVGPPGEEIHTDEHGRIKVRFHWDRSGLRDDRCSSWIRVAQASAGAAWGSMFIPRVGHEVVVSFIDGDPDRPLATGSVYHGTNVPPYPLPADKTKSTIKTQSTPGGGGSNELRFEDKKGSEEVYLHAQKDLNVRVENDKDQEIGGDESLDVSGSRTVTVNECHTETILLAQTITVGAALTQTVGGLMSLNVGAAKIEIVGAASSETVIGQKSTSVGFSYSAKAGTDIKMKSGKSTSITAGTSLAARAGGPVAVSAGKDMTVTAKGAINVEAGKGMEVKVEGEQRDEASQKRTIIAGERVSIQVGSSVVTVDKTGKINIQGKDITVKSEGPIKVDGQKIHVTSQGAVTVEASGKVKVKGGNVGVN